MADGTTEDIEDVEVGDWVWAVDPESGEAGPRQVTALIPGFGTKVLVDIEVGGSTVTATGGHPIWVTTRGEWVDAEDLRPGDVLLDETGVTLLVDDVDVRTARDQAVHNLTIDDLHTFFVEVGDDTILTHNTACPFGPSEVPVRVRATVNDIPPGSSGGAGAYKAIPANLRTRWFKSRTPTCSYCRSQPATALDHVEPRSKGGDLTPDNITGACRHCNSSKQDRVAPKNPPATYTGQWPPPWWPGPMIDWWQRRYGSG
jgi:hypothetical protein